MQSTICISTFIFSLLFWHNAYAQEDLSNVRTQELIKILRQYPNQNYVGCYGESDMRKMQNGKFRDFGIYRRAKLKFFELRLDKDGQIQVWGKSFIFGLSSKRFKGTIKLKKYELINSYDSVPPIEVTSLFNFVYEDQSIFSGELKFTLKKTADSLSFYRYGIALLGYYNNKALNFGYITPSSSGIFRSKSVDLKFCINKSLLQYGWDSYIYSNPQWFDCTFDSFSDKIFPISKTVAEIEYFRKQESKDW